LPQVLRQFWIGLVALVMIAGQIDGALSMQHRVEPVGPFSMAGQTKAGLTAHDYAHDYALVDDGDEHSGTSALTGAPADGSDEPAMRHHHHGGDVQVAILPVDHPIEPGAPDSAVLKSNLDHAPPGADHDGPLDPPRLKPLIA